VEGTSKRASAPAWLLAATVAGVSGLGLLVLGTLATAPAPKGAAPAATHSLELTYQAPGDSTVYQGGTLLTGDPVFLKLNPWIDVHLQDTVDGVATPAAARTLSLSARLIGPGSWQYTVPLDGQASSQGKVSALQVRLDLRSLQSVITAAAARTGQPGDGYQVQLIGASRSADAAPVTFKPVSFQFAGGQLVLVGTATQRGAAVLRSATEPATAVSAAPAERVRIGALSVPGGTVTAVGLGVLALAVVLAAVGLVRRRHDPLAGLTQPLITVAARDLGSRTVMTASVDELFELAKRYNRPVLSMVIAGRPTYAVEEGGTWYGCYVGRQATGTEEPLDPDAEWAPLDDDVSPPPAPRSSPDGSLDPV
jgi:hypothetical protein